MFFKKNKIIVQNNLINLCLPTLGSAKEYLSLTNGSISFHHPWVFPALSMREYKLYLKRINKGYTRGFFITRRSDNHLVGVININDIKYGSFCSGTLGYYLGIDYTGMGYMTEGINLLLGLVFNDFSFHRIEVNIQPENRPSKALVKRAGFKLEGFSTKFLKLDGQWRDHERWALISDEWKAL